MDTYLILQGSIYILDIYIWFHTKTIIKKNQSNRFRKIKKMIITCPIVVEIKFFFVQNKDLFQIYIQYKHKK